MSTPFEETKRCPDCKLTGREESVRLAERATGMERGSRTITFICENERCRGYHERWIVQIRPDGTIPNPIMNREKQYPKRGRNAGKEAAEYYREVLRREQKPGAEVRM